jgi:hypothetical protein
MNDELAYLRILRRIGAVLIVVGTIDVGLMIYCIVNGISYVSCFNLFSIIAGIFLVRGSLSGAAVISRFAAFLLAALVGLAFVWPIFLPPSLALAELRVYPLRFLVLLSFFTAVLAVLFWVVRQLRSRVVLRASARSAIRIRSLRRPVLAAVAIVVITTLMVGLSQKGESTKRAEQIAASKVGSGYRLRVSSLSVTTTAEGKIASGIVTAWNDHEIRQVAVSWKEK